MNCPYCGASMKSGRIETNAVLHIMRHPANIIFESDDYRDKKKVSTPFSRREGWYCDACKKIIGIFDADLYNN